MSTVIPTVGFLFYDRKDVHMNQLIQELLGYLLKILSDRTEDKSTAPKNEGEGRKGAPTPTLSIPELVVLCVILFALLKPDTLLSLYNTIHQISLQ